MPIQIRTATSPEELEQVFRLRYSVYVKEMGLDLEEADHARQMVRGELDQSATILTAVDGDRVVGTVTLNFARNGLGKFVELFGMERFRPMFPGEVSMTTRLMVESEHRNTSLAVRLSKAVHAESRRSRMRFDFLCCHTRQVAFMKLLGYRELPAKFSLSGYGECHAMVLVLGDREHLEKVRSPFLSLFAPGPRDHEAAKLFGEIAGGAGDGQAFAQAA